MNEEQMLYVQDLSIEYDIVLNGLTANTYCYPDGVLITNHTLKDEYGEGEELTVSYTEFINTIQENNGTFTC